MEGHKEEGASGIACCLKAMCAAAMPHGSGRHALMAWLTLTTCVFLQLLTSPPPLSSQWGGEFGGGGCMHPPSSSRGAHSTPRCWEAVETMATLRGHAGQAHAQLPWNRRFAFWDC